MELEEFYSYSLQLEVDGGYERDLLLPVDHLGDSDFDPFSWMMKTFSEGNCFTYWATEDSGLRVVFPDDILSVSFQEIEGQNSVYNGVVCYPQMMERLKKHTEKLAFSFPNIDP